MPMDKIAISIEPGLLARIDAEAAGAGQSRSAFIAEARNLCRSVRRRRNVPVFTYQLSRSKRW